MKRGVLNTKVIIISLMLLAPLAYSKEAAINNPVTEQNKETGQVKNNYIAKDQVDSTLKKHSEIGAANYLQMLLGLFFIVAFIFAVAWLIKRMGTLNPSHSSNLKVVAGLNVGQREKIIVVQVMDEQLLVGVTQSNIQLLTKLETPLAGQASNTLGGFNEKLQSAMSGFKKNTQSRGDV